jgi:DNA-binding FrmR family transcriptional regulator
MREPARTTCRKRLRRIEGRARAAVGMVDEDRHCIDIATQIVAVRAAPETAT